MKRSPSALMRAHSRGSFERLLFESEHSNGLGHEDRSILFRLAQLLVITMRLVTPISYLYVAGFAALYFFCGDEYPLALYIRNALDHRTASIGDLRDVSLRLGLTVLTAWMVIETLFLPYYYYKYVELSGRNDNLTHKATDSKSRMQLVHSCFTALEAAADRKEGSEKYIRKALSGWFLDVDIKYLHRENIAHWTSWAFFNVKMKHLSSEEEEENQEIVDYIEKVAQWKFPPGFATENVPSARLTEDPLFATQRPFFMYAAIAAMNAGTHAYLRAAGFGQLAAFDLDDRSQVIYHRPARSSSNDSNSSSSSGSSSNGGSSSSGSSSSGGSSSSSGSSPGDRNEKKKGLPIVFVHGIGIGFTAYLTVLAQLPTDVDVFLVEWAYVSMLMKSAAPAPLESVQAVVAALDAFNHKKVCIVAHSLGTTLVSWMLHDERGRSYVQSTVLLDPVVFLTCDPTLATGFVYKDPNNTFDFLMHFFVARELFVANAISRNFAWSQNIMFVEDLLTTDSSRAAHAKVVAKRKKDKDSNSTNDSSMDSATRSCGDSYLERDGAAAGAVEHSIFLSLHDPIVPVAPVSRYLQSKAANEGFSNYEVMMFSGTHGEMLLYPRWIKTIRDKIYERSGLAVDSQGPADTSSERKAQ